MGLLDLPLISEMDDIERRAAGGDQEAFDLVMRTISPEKRMFIRRQMTRYEATPREALTKAGIIAETRGRKTN